MADDKIKFSPGNVIKKMRAAASRLDEQFMIFKKMGYTDEELIVVTYPSIETCFIEASVVPMSIVDDGCGAS